ncbi:MAG: Crp/Fnr family transcriptional regulator, partial [Gammaproteobacteria bacterium]|nr:Crp/Fnr family transcriptional regulator [Gammaproteobacteria bacterium]
PIISFESRPLSVIRLHELYPDLACDQSADWLSILDNAQVINVPAKTTLATVGTSCTNFLILLNGTVRIFQNTEDGREMTLYRARPGDVCLLSLNSLIHDRPFHANAKSETNINVILFTAKDFHQAMKVSDAFRTLVLSSLVDTVCTMVQTFYDTAFEPLDMRLACLLGRLFERSGSDTLNITHQDLALELGTTREVISRLLKKLELRECIVLRRGKILIGENKKMPGAQ